MDKPKPVRPKYSSNDGVMLLETDDRDDATVAIDAVLIRDGEEVGVSSGRIPLETRRMVVQQKADGLPSKLVAINCAINVGSVDRIWKKFIEENNALTADMEQAAFNRYIRKKARRAIESGLDCDRDPYRQANVGIRVAKGIGDFVGDAAGGNRINTLILNLPPDWKSRYITAGNNPEPKSDE